MRRRSSPTLSAVKDRALCIVLALALGLTGAHAALAQELPGLPQAAAPAEKAPARTVAVETSPGVDRAIARRLRGIFAQIQGLEDVVVEVHAGVVELSGEVLTSRAREEAERIAGQLEGVVDVQNDLDEVRDLERRLAPAFRDLRERSFDLLARLPLVAVALLVFGLVAALGRLLTAWERPYRRIARNHFARELLLGAIRAAAVLAGAILALQLLDATGIVAAVAGLAGLAGLALSFAFRDLAENYIASVLLSLRQPFLPNDQVVIAGFEGRVVRLTSRATILMSLDGNHIRIPNATVFKEILVNYTRNPRRRFDFTVGVATDVDLGEAQALGLRTLRALPGVLGDPGPAGWIDALGDSNVVLHFFAWIDQREAEWAKARGEAIRVVKEAFDAAGIGMPEPTLNLRNVEASAARPAPSAAAPPALEVDISPDTHLDQEVAEDRAVAGEGDDLLDPDAPRE
jgi:small conductance mechanosensitive channel